MEIVIIGRNGQVAWELSSSLQILGRVRSVGRPEIDLIQPDSLRQIIRELRPRVLVNAAAYTVVDKAEAEPELAMKINAVAPQVMAEEAKRIGAFFISFSTDYVFDGAKASPYTETDVPRPLNAYGASKLAGDHAIEASEGNYLILRTSWVYGCRGHNFLRTIARLARERPEIRVVDDQVGAPTSSYDLAQATRRIIEELIHRKGGRNPEDLRGTYNISSQGAVSWFGFATAIVAEMRSRGLSKSLATIVPITTREYPTAAIRPLNSRLSNKKINAVFGIALPLWNVSLAATMDKLALLSGAAAHVAPSH